jgi:hypothetical protein
MLSTEVSFPTNLSTIAFINVISEKSLYFSAMVSTILNKVLHPILFIFGISLLLFPTIVSASSISAGGYLLAYGHSIFSLYAIYETKRKRAILLDWLIRKCKRDKKFKLGFEELASLSVDIENWDKKRR